MKKVNYYLMLTAWAVVMMALESCSKSSSLPSVNGYNSSNDVAKENLIAHWTFDNTTNEVISSTAPTTANGNTFTTGQIGQALSLSSGHLLYPAIPALSTPSAMGSFTVSVWISNIVNNGSLATEIFSLTQAVATQSDWNTGPVNMLVQTGQKQAINDTLVLDCEFATYINSVVHHGNNVTNGDFSDRGTTWVPVVGVANNWIYYVAVYDGAGSNIDIYANGVLSSNSKFRYRTYNNGTADVGFGPVVTTPPIQALIGAIPNIASGFPSSPNQTWQGLMTGNMDDLRLYNKVLTATEIGSLYQLGLSGR